MFVVMLEVTEVRNSEKLVFKTHVQYLPQLYTRNYSYHYIANNVYFDP